MGSRRRLGIAFAAAAAVLSVALPAPSAAAPYDDWNPGYEGFPSGVERNPRADCASGGDFCIRRTLGEMWRRFHRVVPVCEHNNVFSLTYLRVTEAIRDAVDRGFYEHRRWLNRQDAIFARMYFLAYDNWSQGRRRLVPESWRIAFDAGRDRSVEGIGNLLLSMNAHINRDFPFVLYHAGLTDPDGSSRKEDHDAGNEILRRLYKPMLRELARRFDASIDDYDVPGTPTDDEAIFQTLVGWRETTWQNAERLAEAESDAERRQVARSIEQYANEQAAAILAGSLYTPADDREARERRCARNGGQRPRWRRGADVARPPAAAELSGRLLSFRARCPDGPGPCRGAVRVRIDTTRGPGGWERAGRRRLDVDPGRRQGFTVPLDRRLRSALASRERLIVGVRSLLAPGVERVLRSRPALRSG